MRLCTYVHTTMAYVCVHVHYCDLRISFSEYHQFCLQACIKLICTLSSLSDAIHFYTLGPNDNISLNVQCASFVYSAASACPSQFKQHEENHMQRALNAVRGVQSIRQAALECGIHKSTLGDWVGGRVTHGTLSGLPELHEEGISFRSGQT